MTRDTTTCVVAANGGNTPRAASSIVYTVAINVPGEPAITLTGVTPSGSRFPDVVDTVPAPVGSTWPVEVFANRYYCFIRELPDLGECS